MNYKSSILLGNILMAILNLMPNPFPHKKTRILVSKSSTEKCQESFVIMFYNYFISWVHFL